MVSLFGVFVGEVSFELEDPTRAYHSVSSPMREKMSQRMDDRLMGQQRDREALRSDRACDFEALHAAVSKRSVAQRSSSRRTLS